MQPHKTYLAPSADVVYHWLPEDRVHDLALAASVHVGGQVLQLAVSLLEHWPVRFAAGWCFGVKTQWVWHQPRLMLVVYRHH